MPGSQMLNLNRWDEKVVIGNSRRRELVREVV
jgi:hypothetical protein